MKSKTLIWSTFLVSVASLASRFLGVWRENLLARTFGGIVTSGSNVLDAYYAAFRIPDFLYNLVILSVGSAIFVPILRRELEHSPADLQWTMNNFLHVCLILLMGGGLVLIGAAPWLVPILAPGFSPDMQAQTVGLVRLMMVSPILFGISSLTGSYLSIFKNFSAFIWSPIVYNLSIIGGIIFLTPSLGVYGVAWGVVIGALAHVLVQWWPLIRNHYRYQWVCDFSHRTIKEVGRLVLPRIVGVSAAQLNLLTDTILATTLATGSLTILNWTQNMQYLPVGLIGVSISITAFTVLTDYAVQNRSADFMRSLTQQARLIIFLSLPVSVAMVVLRYPIVELILNYGKFSADPQNLWLTANALAIFGLSLVFQGLVPLYSRAFFAYQDTKTPVLSTVVAVLLNIGLSVLLVWYWHGGVLGLACSFSVANLVNAVILERLLGRRLNLPAKLSLWWPFGLEVLGSAVVAGGLMWGVDTFLGSGGGKLFIALKMALAGGVGAGAVLVWAGWRRWPEMALLWKLVKRA